MLANLNEEEQGEENHPELWLRFAEGVGYSRQEVMHNPPQNVSSKLVNDYFGLVRENFAKALRALYAYERQTPSVAESKVQGLQQFYGIQDDRALQFFIVHKEADVWHSEECAAIISKLVDSEQEQVRQGAIDGAKLLWEFLDGINSYN